MSVSELNNSSTLKSKGIVSPITQPPAYPSKGRVISVDTEILLELEIKLLLVIVESAFTTTTGLLTILFGVELINSLIVLLVASIVIMDVTESP